MSTNHPDHGYRSDIDGLRAVAVLLVVLFHAGVGFPGGFIGVDVFFVISGFLITGIIVRDLDSGRFSFGNFWERRVRRIVPASLSMTAVTLLAGWLLLLPQDFRSLGRSAAAHLAMAANVNFWMVTDYFAGPAEEMPLLHTWSLAVEEQFYLILPLLLWAGYRVSSSNPRKAITRGILVVAILSLFWSIWEVRVRPSSAFFLLPSRAWELLLGSALALIRTSPGTWPAWVRETLPALGGACIVGAGLAFSNSMPFPGLAAALPCAGAALIILAGSARPTWTSRFLSTGPMGFIGKISYSLYLWHWPLLALLRGTSDHIPTTTENAIAVAISFPLAYASWRWIENPTRSRAILSGRGQVVLTAASCMAAVAVLGAWIYLKGGFPKRFPILVNQLTDARGDRVANVNHTPADVAAGRVSILGAKRAEQPISILIWGDSHARNWMPALDTYCSSRGLGGAAVVYSSTAPFIDHFTRTPAGLNEQSIVWAANVVEFVRTRRIPLVLLAARWERETKAVPAAEFAAALNRTVAALESAGAKVCVIKQVPSHDLQVPKALALGVLSGNTSAFAWQRSVQEHEARMAPLTAWARSQPTHCLLDLNRPLLEPKDDRYQVWIDQRPLYIDEHHLTETAVRQLMAPALAEALDALRNSSKP